jgi:hypothetical protein
MSTGFVQTGPTQQITTLGVNTWPAARQFSTYCGAVRVYNSGSNEAAVVVSSNLPDATSPASLSDTVPSNVISLAANTERVLGPFSGPVYFNAAGTAGNKVQFTPGSGGL